MAAHSTYRKTPSFERDIFHSGEYIKHFYPDDKRNPFLKIYSEKRRDTLNIINQSENSKSVLDVGGGMGRVSLALAKSPQKKVILSDISFDMLTLAANHPDRLSNINIVNNDAHFLPFRDNSFDLVVGLDILCHLETPHKALCEFHRVLRKHGILIIDSTNSNPLWTLFYPRYLGRNPLNWLKTMQFRGVLPGWEHIVKHYPKKQFYSLLNGAGFEVIRNLDYGPKICPKWHMAVSRRLN